MTRGRLAGPEYRQLFRGIHVAAHVSDSVELRAAAALLLCPPEAVLCGRTAALLRGLPVEDDGTVHVGLPTGATRVDRRPGLCPHRDIPTEGGVSWGGRTLVGVPEMWLGVAKERPPRVGRGSSRSSYSVTPCSATDGARRPTWRRT
ncbi:MAG TPA: hypothetical protein VK908_02940 [Jiangellales bacterium]|nr:hypothetical protein [Jiangellales bacterium]